MMASVIIYTTLTCPYCVHAKELLDSKHVAYQEIHVDKNPAQLKEMIAKSGGRKTVPQIFINDQHIGGFDDLQRLNESGKLDALLQGAKNK